MNIRELDNRLDSAVQLALRHFGEAEDLLCGALGRARKGRRKGELQDVFSRLLYLYSWTRDTKKAAPILREWLRGSPHSVMPLVEGARFYYRSEHYDRALQLLRRLRRPAARMQKGRELRTYFSGLHLKGLLEVSVGDRTAAVGTLRVIVQFARRYGDEIGTSFELDFVEALAENGIATAGIRKYLEIAKWSDFDAVAFGRRALILSRRISQRRSTHR